MASSEFLRKEQKKRKRKKEKRKKEEEEGILYRSFFVVNEMRKGGQSVLILAPHWRGNRQNSRILKNICIVVVEKIIKA